MKLERGRVRAIAARDEICSAKVDVFAVAAGHLHHDVLRIFYILNSGREPAHDTSC
ncbi:hypothetical protein GGE45_005646 [Rhizobium aethiopicum]|uniref:Uncharacterized protein n=1 Tax=Rhizobium aethiopicum TaxID=1138170 RepID=A0A7W6QDF5_9HYPH|nr:hypothetical protein [Rhizobium aethiopicum]MBB4583278.1 hypothetical protein [Rhizobium aethiopicum]